MIKALDWAKQSGLARFTGISSHDRPHIKKLIEKYPDQLEVICTPYTARTKVVTDESGLWAAMKQFDVGWLGIKPFASNSLFKGDSTRAIRIRKKTTSWHDWPSAISSAIPPSPLPSRD